MKTSVVCRIISFFLVLSLLAVTAPDAFAKHFDDVTSGMNQEQLDAINYVSDNGIMEGTATNLFSPYQTLTRGMFVTILYRLSGDSGNYNGSAYFTDVSPTAYYNKAVGWAYANNITDGISDTEFGPNIVLITQQVMTFLYRYAGYKELSQTTKTFVGGSVNEVISDATDYSQVSGYAITPMTWASNYGIIVRSSMSNTLHPKSDVSRVSCALYIHRFALNVQGINVWKDAFAFSNSRNSFVANADEITYISAADKARLENILAREGVIGSLSLEKYTGYCFGMAVAAVLDIQGKIDLNGNFCRSGIKCLHDIPHPSTVNVGGNNSTYSGPLLLCKDYSRNKYLSEVESKIAMYWYSWGVTTVSGNLHYHELDLANITGEKLKETVQKLQRGGVGVFSFGYIRDDKTIGHHSIIAFGKPESTTYGYRIKLYDCNYPNQIRYLHITVSSSGAYSGYITDKNLTNRRDIKFCKFEKDLSAYALIDIDGYDNGYDSIAPSTRSVENGTTIIQVIADEDFSIVNERGEDLIFSEGTIAGSMECYGFDFFPGGSGFPCGFVFAVEPAKEFECIQSDECDEGTITKFSVVQDKQYVSADITEGKIAHTVELCQNDLS